MYNSHWKDRLLERGKNIPNDVFDSLMKELKGALLSENVVYSTKDPNRCVVKGPHNLKYLLQKTTSMTDGKQIYIPITVLAPYMKFN